MKNSSKKYNLWQAISACIIVSLALVACNSGSKIQPPTPNPTNPSTPAPSAPDTLDSQRTTWTISSNFKNEQFVDVGLGLENAREGLGTQSILTASDLSVNLTASNVVDLNKLDEAPTGEGKKRLTYTFTNNTGKMLASVMIGMNARNSQGIQSMAYHAHDLAKPTSPEPKIINLQNRTYMIANPFVTWNLGAPNEVILAKGASFTLTLEVSYTDKDFTPAFDFAAILVDEAQASHFFDTYVRYKVGGWKYATRNPTPQGNLGEEQTSSRAPRNVDIQDGSTTRSYYCSYSDYSLKQDVKEIVGFRAGLSSQLWAGAILRGDPFRSENKMQIHPAHIAPRAPITISVDLVSGGKVSKVVENPTQANVQQAIADLINGKSYESSTFNYQEVKTHSAEQTAVNLGVSVEYLATSVEASMNAEHSVEETTVTALIRETLFTVSVSAPATPSAFFAFPENDPKAPMQAIGRSVWAKDMGEGNPPIYVASVDYGRTMMLTVTSNKSEAEIKAALKGSYTGAATVSGHINAEHTKLLRESKIEISAVGGDSSKLGEVKAKGDLSIFFNEKLKTLAAAKPLAYRFAAVADNAEVKVGRLTGYQVESCVLKKQVATGKSKANITLTLTRFYVDQGCDSGQDEIEMKAIHIIGGTYGSAGKPVASGYSGSFPTNLDDGSNVDLNISYQTVLNYDSANGSNQIGIRAHFIEVDTISNDTLMDWDKIIDPLLGFGNTNREIVIKDMRVGETKYGAYQSNPGQSCGATLHFKVKKNAEE